MTILLSTPSIAGKEKKLWLMKPALCWPMMERQALFRPTRIDAESGGNTREGDAGRSREATAANSHGDAGRSVGGGEAADLRTGQGPHVLSVVDKAAC